MKPSVLQRYGARPCTRFHDYLCGLPFALTWPRITEMLYQNFESSLTIEDAEPRYITGFYFLPAVPSNQLCASRPSKLLDAGSRALVAYLLFE
jgi:hypothetical protein